MPRGPELSREQRLIIFRHAAAGADISSCNGALVEGGFPPVHPGSYDGNLRREGRLLRVRPDLMEVLVAGPIPYGDWPEDWKALAREQGPKS